MNILKLFLRRKYWMLQKVWCRQHMKPGREVRLSKHLEIRGIIFHLRLKLIKSTQNEYNFHLKRPRNCKYVIMKCSLIFGTEHFHYWNTQMLLKIKKKTTLKEVIWDNTKFPVSIPSFTPHHHFSFFTRNHGLESLTKEWKRIHPEAGGHRRLR